MLRWDSSKATRPSVVRGREVGPRVVKDLTIAAQPDKHGPAALAVHVEMATLELTEDGQVSRQTTPVAVRVTVARNTDWTVSSMCEHGPETATLSAAAGGALVTPKAMFLPCDVSLKYRDSFADLTYLVSFVITGDGAVTARLLDGTVRVE